MKPFDRSSPLAMALAFAIAAAGAQQARAAAEPDPGPAPAGPTFKVMGPSTCAGWPKSGAITGASKAVPLNWALGFLSGWAAQANVQLLHMVEPEKVSAWLDTYCAEHKDVSLPLAVRELERQLEAELPTPEPAVLETDPAPVATPAPTPTQAKKPVAKTTRHAKAKVVRRKPAAPAAKPATPAAN